MNFKIKDMKTAIKTLQNQIQFIKHHLNKGSYIDKDIPQKKAEIKELKLAIKILKNANKL